MCASSLLHGYISCCVLERQTKYYLLLRIRRVVIRRMSHLKDNLIIPVKTVYFDQTAMHSPVIRISSSHLIAITSRRVTTSRSRFWLAFAMLAAVFSAVPEHSKLANPPPMPALLQTCLQPSHKRDSTSAQSTEPAYTATFH